MLELREHKQAVRCVAFCPGRPLLASGSQDRTVKLWDLSRSKVMHTYEHDGSVEALTFSPDGDLILSGDAGGHIVGRPLDQPDQWEFTRGQDSVRKLACQHSIGPGGLLFASAAWSGRVTVWGHDTRFDSTWSAGLQDLVFAVDWSALYLATGNSVTFWEYLSDEARVIDTNNAVSCLAISPDGFLLAAGTTDGSIFILDVSTGETRMTLEGHSWVVYSVQFTPDGRSLLSGSADRSVRVWDAQIGHQRAAYEWGQSWVTSVALAPDGMTAAAAHGDGAIILFDLDV